MSVLAVSLAVAIALRIAIVPLAASLLSVDRWYWKAYIAAARRQSKTPPDLPGYLLDEHHWYPPLFPRLLSAIPPALFDRTEPWIAMILDLARLALLVATGRVVGLSDDRLAAAAVAYATAPVILTYNVQLNPRALGALFLDAMGSLVIAIWVGRAPALFAWTAILLLGALVLLTHKMTAQLLLFLCAAFAIAVDFRVLSLVPAWVAAAVVLSAGFYLRVLTAHGDILAFWGRNWPWLHADPIRQSPVYGEPGYVSPGLLHQPGWRGRRRHSWSLFRTLPGAWLLAAALIATSEVVTSAPARWFAVWAALELAFAILTTVVPSLKALGAGSLYLFNAAYPVALTAGFAWGGPATARWAVALGVLLSLALTVVLMKRLRSQAAATDADWEAVVHYLAEAPAGPVLCFPANLHDEIAYRTRQPVVFGGHGYGFRRLEDVFPRMRVRFPELRVRYGLRYVIARQGTLNAKALADLPGAPRTFGAYLVFEWPA